MEEMSRFPALEKFISQNYLREKDPQLEDLKQIIAFEIYRRKEG
jgi:hypothetical protein